MNNPVSFLFIANNTTSVECWAPFLDLVHPVLQSRFRHNNKMRSMHIFVMLHIPKKGYRLECFSKTLKSYEKGNT